MVSDRAPAPVTYTIAIENMQFNPKALAVRKGDRIVWVNRDLIPHTVTAHSRAFDSSSIAPGASWVLVPASNGNYAYVCSFHPTMKGMLTVR
jgi:plastocyanin